MNSSLPLLGDKQFLSFLCLRTSKTLSLGCLMSVKLIYVFSPFHMLFLSILYQNSCKTNNISSKLGFAGFLMESK